MNEEILNKLIKRITFIIIGIALFVWILFNFDDASNLWNNTMRILQPFCFGILIALILNAPVRFFERKLAKKDNKGNNITNKKLAVLLSVISVLLAIIITVALVIPQLINFGKAIISNLPIYTRKGY